MIQEAVSFETHQGFFNDAELPYEYGKYARNWMAEIRLEPFGKYGGIGRNFYENMGGACYELPDLNKPIEMGGEEGKSGKYYRRKGRRRYFVFTELVGDRIWGYEFATARQAIRWAENPPPQKKEKAIW